MWFCDITWCLQSVRHSFVLRSISSDSLIRRYGARLCFPQDAFGRRYVFDSATADNLRFCRRVSREFHIGDMGYRRLGKELLFEAILEAKNGAHFRILLEWFVADVWNIGLLFSSFWRVFVKKSDNPGVSVFCVSVSVCHYFPFLLCSVSEWVEFNAPNDTI